MAKKRKKTYSKKIMTSSIVLVLAVCHAGLVALPVHATATPDDLQLSLTSNKKVDVVLTLGQSNMNVSTFGSDLTNKLVEKGVKRDKINITSIQTSNVDVKNSFTWEKYDHGRGQISGNDVYFYGYTTSGYTDYWYNDDQTEGKKTFTFTLDERRVNYHSFYGGGFIFGAKKYSDNTMEGYVLLFDSGTASIKKIPRTDMNTINNTYSNFPYQNLTSVSKSYGIHDIKMEIDGTKVKVTDNSNVILTYTLPQQIGNGFGIVADHNSHNCSQTSTFLFKNLVMQNIQAKDFREVIKEPKWTDNSERFIVNVDDQSVSDFDNSTALGQMLPRFINEGINFIGLGTNQNKAQLESFIAKNNNNGVYYENANYQTALENTANYIVQKLKEDNSKGQYVLVGEPIDITVDPSSLATNTGTPEYPQGRWRIDHDYTYFENNLGQASWANQWQKNLQMVFDKPGQYDISFGDKHPNPRYVYAHRKPIASFSTIVKNNGSNFGVTLQDYSYDLDMESRTDKGIAEREWKWRKTTDANWTAGQIPSSLPIGSDYVVQLRVKDYQGEWSSPEARYITTSSVVSQPVANFTISPNLVTLYETLNVSDTSYDPAGRTITDKVWTITKDGVQVYSGATPVTSFRTSGEGIYRVTLKVKNDANLWSEEFTRNVTVTADTEKPEAIVTPTSQSWSPQNAVVNITFSDKGGSGFKQQRYVVTQSPTPPTSGWSAYSSATSRTVTISQEGKNYLHIEGEDEAGNKFTRTIGEYQIDRTAPEVSSAVNFSTWTNKDVSIRFMATDKVSGVNRVQLPNGNWINDTDITYVVSTNGVQTFTVVDNAGNVTNKSVNVNYIDKETPNAPTISLNGAENIWVNQEIQATIRDNGDGGVSGFRTEYKLSGAMTQDWTPYGSPLVINNDGITTISARVVDNAGNISSVVSKTVKIDQNAPDLTITPDIANLTNTDIVLTAKATDKATGVKRIQLPNGNWVIGSQVSYRVSENGLYTFKTEDNFGNVGTFDYMVKNIKKNVLITNKREVEVELNADDLYSGVTHMQMRNEEESWLPWEVYTTRRDWVLSPGDGLKHFWVQYRDKVGNVSPPVEDIIILDMTKPTASLLTINNDDLYTKNKPVTLKINGSDALTGVKDMYLSNDNKNWVKVAYSEEMPWVLSDGDGVKTVYLKISDVAGNMSDVITDTIFLDTTKPLANITINNGDSYSATRNVRLTLTYSDIGGSGVDKVKVIEGGSEYTLPAPTPNSPITIPWTLDFGVVKTVSILVVDKAGNVSDMASDSIIVDKLTLKDFTLENVVNPLEFNSKHPFTPKTWAFAPQPMLAGGNITFSIDVKQAVDAEVVQDSVNYKAEVVGDNGYHQVFIGTMKKAGDHYTQTLTIPKDAPNGAKVYVNATAQRKLLVTPYDAQTVYFPGGEDSLAKAQIGVIGENIYDVIRFNEIQ